MFEPVTPDAEARAEAARRSILGADPYLDEPGLLERVGQWLSDRFNDLLGGGVDQGSSLLAQFGRFLDAAVPWILAGMVALGAWWVWRHRSGLSAVGRGSVRDDVRVGHLDDARSAADWLREAGRLEAEGRHTEAVRAAYRAIVAHLVARELVPSTPGLTVGAHRDLVGRSDVLDALQAEGFAAASDVFENAWYGPPRTPAGTAARPTAESRTGQSGAGMASGDRPGGEVDLRTASAADVAVVLDAAERLGVGR
jgi:hypothetical protein